MFQSFESSASADQGKARIKLLREQMKAQKLDWFLVPHADEHQNEYLPLHAERLAWLTGFTGSAGFAIIGLEKAFIFVDGRYTNQVRHQVDTSVIESVDLVANRLSKYIRQIASDGDRIGFDARLITIGQFKAWETSANANKSKMVSCENLIDAIWIDQPSPPMGKVSIHPEEYAGKSASEKINEVRKIISKDGAEYLLLTDPASLAWIFNIRGSDVIHNPLALGYAIVPAKDEQQPILFMDKKKLTSKTKTYLKSFCTISNPSTFEKKLGTLSKKSKIHCDPNLVSTALGNIITRRKGEILKKRDPIVLLRAVKNKIELEGARNAHVRDGVACVRFLHWIDNQAPNSVDEIAAAQKLESFRAKTAKLMGSKLNEISFDTISGAGGNGAIVHYRVTEETNSTLSQDSLYLVDSGGQYNDGTTDITRTVAIGNPPIDAVTDFTLVLKGHIAIALARFPKGTRGVELDTLARNALWQHGKDYAHGTGHGVGSYLNVHEGPQSISKRGTEPIVAGMITSNEPGFYKEGEYGIRIENLIIAKDGDEIDDDNPMMGFETITACPIDIRLIDPSLMTTQEIEWLNNYHLWVNQTLSPYLNKKEQAWLNQATREIFKQA